jgi:hypothetical protein
MGAATPGGVRASAAFAADKDLKQRVAVVLKHLANKASPAMLQQVRGHTYTPGWTLLQGCMSVYGAGC